MVIAMGPKSFLGGFDSGRQNAHARGNLTDAAIPAPGPWHRRQAFGSSRRYGGQNSTARQTSARVGVA